MTVTETCLNESQPEGQNLPVETSMGPDTSALEMLCGTHLAVLSRIWLHETKTSWKVAFLEGNSPSCLMGSPRMGLPWIGGCSYIVLSSVI